MLIRNSLIHSIRKIKEFLQKDIGEEYERQLVQKFMYEGTTVSHQVIPRREIDLMKGRASAQPASLLSSVPEASSAAVAPATDTAEAVDGEKPVVDGAEKAMVDGVERPGADDAEKPAAEESPLVGEVASPAPVDRADEADDELVAPAAVGGPQTLADSLAALSLGSADASASASTSSARQSPRTLLISRGAKREGASPAFMALRFRENAPDNQRLKNGETWGEVMRKDLDSFRVFYNNTLKGVMSLEDIKRLILIKFLRALEQIEANAALLDLELKALVDIQVAEVLDLLSTARDDAALRPLPSIKFEHGEGETEFHVHATKCTLDKTEAEMRLIDSAQYKLPCDIFKLTNSMLNSKNVLLLALNTGFGYLAQSFFYESRALAIQAKYSQYNPSAQYSYLWEMQFSSKLAALKRQHWITTNNNLKSELSSASFSKEGGLTFPGGETAYLQTAERVISAQQKSAELLRRNTIGSKERLDLSYDVILTDIARRYQSRTRPTIV